MFDKTYLSLDNGPSHINADVTVKRAPTDASVALLREMESAANESVVEAMRLTSCGVEAVAQRYDDQMNLRSYIVIHYKVNGQKRSVKVEMEYRDELMTEGRA